MNETGVVRLANIDRFSYETFHVAYNRRNLSDGKYSPCTDKSRRVLFLTFLSLKIYFKKNIFENVSL